MKKFIRSLSAAALALAMLSIPGQASAYYDTGYYTVSWVQVESTGNIAFRLNESIEVYYRCEAPLLSGCQGILLTALSTGREVRVYYGSSTASGHSPAVGSTQVVHHLRMR